MKFLQKTFLIIIMAISNICAMEVESESLQMPVFSHISSHGSELYIFESSDLTIAAKAHTALFVGNLFSVNVKFHSYPYIFKNNNDARFLYETIKFAFEQHGSFDIVEKNTGLFITARQHQPPYEKMVTLFISTTASDNSELKIENTLFGSNTPHITTIKASTQLPFLVNFFQALKHEKVIYKDQ